jgi:hypothetical protein
VGRSGLWRIHPLGEAEFDVLTGMAEVRGPRVDSVSFALDEGEDLQVAVGGSLLGTAFPRRLGRPVGAIESDAGTREATAAELITDARATASTRE